LPPVGTENYKVGENVAITPGKVIFRNRLIELIQYSPVTETVYKEPILIIPAWIMKYYILDLSAKNSLVNYLVNLGHTVFIVSWKNPEQSDRDLGLDDYINLGVLCALDVINTILPKAKVHTVGYCIGGTLLMIAAAALAAKTEDQIKSITLFAAEVDFREAGELSLFIDESQITYLEDIMWEKGYLDGAQMAYAFSMLRSSELIWSRVIHDYLLGERKPLFDLMAWDYDTTRLPYRMQSEYLRKLFQNNMLVQGKFTVNGKRVALGDINVPIFAVSTVSDHVAPWRSVYRVHLFTRTDVTFVLTTGGHNAGIVNPPENSERSFQMMTMHQGEKHISSDTWVSHAPSFEGSWWPKWHEWIVEQSSEKISPPSMGNPDAGINVLCEAPGTYVLVK
jgi:polyhydroxyalkanoate synthase